ncbi:TolB family protein [Mastigocladopsis repens]|uniref:TolB family protein n=1 Tax=Mastigocladopsis repens TaxID=221287 RepID=UPI0003621190|nr:PD40 domain-containing protein [Mastigocladopsis repens]
MQMKLTKRLPRLTSSILLGLFLTTGLTAMYTHKLVQAAFPGQNGKLVFLSNLTNNQTGEIYTMNPDGTGETPLTTGGGKSYPAWSPDGKMIAFTSGSRVWVMNADGSGQRQITNPDVVQYDMRLSWTSDGKILFMRYGGYESVIIQYFTVNPDGTGETRITQLDNAQEAVWSPDGTKIAFTISSGDEVTSYTNLWVMNVNGSGKRQLISGNRKDSSPRWSPDSTKIVFEANNSNEVQVINSDGTGLKQLADSAAEPDFSPDGSKIVFSRNQQLWTMNSDGSDQQEIRNSVTTTEVAPNWQPLPSGTSTPTPTPTNGRGKKK